MPERHDVRVGARDALDTRIPVGTDVEVRNRYSASWSAGFELVAAEADAYRVRRRSDGHVLPVAFPRDAIRRH